ncbi:MAG: DUF1007 family protein [Rhodospirillaceae bacterium]|nr:DUF1007 family protein [Rhodospirillaceae bacterium]
MRVLAWLVAVMSAAIPQAAMAHPHVFIDNRVTLLFADGAVTGFRTEWRFDEIFSADLLAQYDADGDGVFNAAESDQVRDGTLPNLKGFRYFTYAYVGGEDLGQLEPAAFKADIVDGVARFRFTYALPSPVDPRKSKFGVSIYDHEYYVEVLMAATEPLAIDGDAGGCQATVADDPEHAYYEGFVIPQMVAVGCP